VRRRPGLRSPGTVDGGEIAIRAILGQQVSVQAARTQGARLAAALGRPLVPPDGSLRHAFPRADAVAGASDAVLTMPVVRREAIRAVAGAMAEGKLVLDAGADREDAVRQLLAVKGVGRWTAAYVSMRALGDPDVLLDGDLGVRHALSRLGADGQAANLAERCRPWGSYVTHHLWASLGD
jgi:AraC family transcriptional regulator of adaptative response / DNA-3-methyladenine glycosylase II